MFLQNNAILYRKIIDKMILLRVFVVIFGVFQQAYCRASRVSPDFLSSGIRPAIQQPLAPPLQNQQNLINDVKNLDNRLLSKCLKTRGQFQSDTCDKFVSCWDGQVVEESCPKGLLFNPKGYCDYPTNVPCKLNGVENPPSIQTTTTVSTPTTALTIPQTDPRLKGKCLQVRGQFPSDDCNKYVNCWDDFVIEQECPEGLVFSSKGYCDYPYSVDCQNRNLPNRLQQEQKIGECPSDYGTFRNKTDCGSYFTCLNGKIAATYTCPTGLKFNDNIGVCDYEDRVDCSKESTFTWSYNSRHNFLDKLPKELMQQVVKCTPGTVLKLNQQCTVVSLCRDTLSEIVVCPDGLAYNTESNNCIVPHLAKC